MSASPNAVRDFLPPAARKQVERANQLVESLRLGNTPAAPQPPAAAAAPPSAPAAPPTPPAAAATPSSDPPAAPTLEQLNAQWEHKYKVLQGKYNAEVPRLQAQLQENQQLLVDMRQQLTNTQTMLASLSTGQPAAPQNAAPPARSAQRRVKDDEVKTFGPDLYDFIKRSALEAVEPELARVAQPIEQRLSRTEQTVDATTRTANEEAIKKMYAHLNTEVPNWEQLNELPEFLAWLGEKDPYVGVPRGQLLSQAYQANDGARVVAFFKGFQSEHAAITPQPQAAAPNAAPAADPEAQLLQLVAPGTPKAGPASGTPNDAGKRVWTRADVQDLYRRINEFTKKSKQPPQELRALEADLIRAQAENRIRA